ncbi:MAG: amphi-Trp domain-containing protein [Haloglomus sp.]
MATEATSDETEGPSEAASDETEGPNEATSDETDEEAESERTVIRQGRDFEQEYRLRAADAGEFLVRLGEQLQADEELTVVDESGDEAWELPFAFGGPVRLELDYEGMGEPELEIEVEIPARTEDEAPEVR